MSRTRMPLAASAAALVALAAAGCAPQPQNTPAAAGSKDASRCTTDNPSLHKRGQLTVATDSPAYEPWFDSNTPSNGKGFESAVAYAVAEKLGFERDQVKWVVEPFAHSYAPGPKPFDFDINQISITPQRAKAVDFSTSY
ncbi:transporter substrate-binding domain-containing protein [Streptomyces roseolus]